MVINCRSQDLCVQVLSTGVDGEIGGNSGTLCPKCHYGSIPILQTISEAVRQIIGTIIRQK